MKKVILPLVAGTILIVAAHPVQAKGCIKGAVIGSVAGHYAHHHAILGAIAGCVIGHHEAKKHAREERERVKRQNSNK